MLQRSRRARFAVGVRRLAHRAAEVGRGAIRALPLVLVAAALSLFFAQPRPEPAELDALIAIAGIVPFVRSSVLRGSTSKTEMRRSPRPRGYADLAVAVASHCSRRTIRRGHWCWFGSSVAHQPPILSTN